MMAWLLLVKVLYSYLASSASHKLQFYYLEMNVTDIDAIEYLAELM